MSTVSATGQNPWTTFTPAGMVDQGGAATVSGVLLGGAAGYLAADRILSAGAPTLGRGVAALATLAAASYAGAYLANGASSLVNADGSGAKGSQLPITLAVVGGVAGMLGGGALAIKPLMNSNIAGPGVVTAAMVGAGLGAGWLGYQLGEQIAS